MLHLENNLANIIKENMPNEKICTNLAGFYSIFSDSTRLKILISLLLGEMCVNDLSRLLNINQTTISHQLKILKSNGVVVPNFKFGYRCFSTDRYNFVEGDNRLIDSERSIVEI